MKTKRKVILTFILLALFSSALYADGFQWQNFFYRPLDNQPSCVEVRHVSSFENEYPDLTVYEREEARSIYTAVRVAATGGKMRYTVPSPSRKPSVRGP